MGTTTLMSLEEFELLEGPEDVELLNGEPIHMSLPKPPHTDICEGIFKRLDGAFDRQRAVNPEVQLGRVHIGAGYLLTEDPPTLLGPDVSINHLNQPIKGYYRGAPSVVFEVVSEHERAKRLDEKITAYLAHGANEVWAIYPDIRHAWVYRQGTARLETQTIRSEFFPDVEIPLADVL